ncbi:hypothetical protein F442_13495 [Phytophthora nicotianae P10297]|uniref:Uncharacterized protein n=1 Tax=Phytophthora nicotianae P10297 TaxID=1317064 RepID=W2YWA5_PHYNI|nr:hypothetical protein F442_13495 [Phytophthora nicotianae P10297]
MGELSIHVSVQYKATDKYFEHSPDLLIDKTRYPDQPSTSRKSTNGSL